MSKIVLLHYERDFSDAMTNALRLAGYDVFQAHSSVDAWSLIQSVNPDVVLTDYPAYVATDEGEATITSLMGSSGLLQRTPVISLTSDPSPDWLASAAAAGVVESAVLPISEEDLLNIVRRYVKPRTVYS